MTGHWAATVGDVHMEEAWIGPEGGVMLGVHRDVRVGGTAFFEYLRIEERADGLVYIASRMGRGTTEFALGNATSMVRALWQTSTLSMFTVQL